jgi:hypothetical protein
MIWRAAALIHGFLLLCLYLHDPLTNHLLHKFCSLIFLAILLHLLLVLLRELSSYAEEVLFPLLLTCDEIIHPSDHIVLSLSLWSDSWLGKLCSI